jgi:apolipoprotein N-acyltransferase
MAYDRRLNSMFLVEEGRVHPEHYDKIELTPFGEVIPYVWRWKWLQRQIEQVGAGGMKFDLGVGSTYTVFDIPIGVSETGGAGYHVSVVTPICFEATKSGHCRRLVYGERGGRRAALIINTSNDGWFGSFPGGREQHLLSCRWRCVELGVPMVRSVNTGISAFMDEQGKLRRRGPDGRGRSKGVDGVIIADVAVNPGDGTIFGKIGNLFGWCMVGLAGALPVMGWIVGRRVPNTRVAVA